MTCPECDCKDTQVLDSRPRGFGNMIRRRRRCLECEFRFTTYEVNETYLNQLEHGRQTLRQFSRLMQEAV